MKLNGSDSLIRVLIIGNQIGRHYYSYIKYINDKWYINDDSNVEY